MNCRVGNGPQLAHGTMGQHENFQYMGNRNRILGRFWVVNYKARLISGRAWACVAQHSEDTNGAPLGQHDGLARLIILLSYKLVNLQSKRSPPLMKSDLMTHIITRPSHPLMVSSIESNSNLTTFLLEIKLEKLNSWRPKYTQLTILETIMHKMCWHE